MERLSRLKPEPSARNISRLSRTSVQRGHRNPRPPLHLAAGNPWELRRPNEAVDVGFGGHTERWSDSTGKYCVRWAPASVVRGIPYDTAILGYRSGIANDLRLWRSESTESFYFDRFNSGDYQGAVAGKVFAENITKVQ